VVVISNFDSLEAAP